MRQRPLSPHLQVYKLPAAAIISISHRILSGALYFMGVVFALYCVLDVFGMDLSWLQSIVFSWWGKLKITFILPMLVFYALSEIRYIIWFYNSGFSKSFVCLSNSLTGGVTIVSAMFFAWYIWS